MMVNLGLQLKKRVNVFFKLKNRICRRKNAI